MNSAKHTSSEPQTDPAALLFPIRKTPAVPKHPPEKPGTPGRDAKTKSPGPKHPDPLNSRGHPEVDSPLAG